MNKNLFARIFRKLIFFLRTPRLSILLFQIRIIERYTGIDLFFISPRRLIIYFFELILLRSLKKNNFERYGNYILDKNNIPKNPVVYSGGVGKNISFDLNFFNKHGGKIRLFDPTESSIQHMNKIKLPKNFKFYHYALFYKNKKIKLYQDPTNRIKSASVTNFFSFDKNSFFIANAYNLQTLTNKFGDKSIDILKLDIEGAAENLIKNYLDYIDKKNYPKQIISAFEVPLNYIEFIKFLKKIYSLIKILEKNYDLYNIRDRSRGVEMEVLAIKKK